MHLGILAIACGLLLVALRHRRVFVCRLRHLHASHGGTSTGGAPLLGPVSNMSSMWSNGLWGFNKVRYRGLAKDTVRLYTAFALAIPSPATIAAIEMEPCLMNAIRRKHR
jgi:hypothetical protein